MYFAAADQGVQYGECGVVWYVLQAGATTHHVSSLAHSLSEPFWAVTALPTMALMKNGKGLLTWCIAAPSALITPYHPSSYVSTFLQIVHWLQQVKNSLSGSSSLYLNRSFLEVQDQPQDEISIATEPTMQGRTPFLVALTLAFSCSAKSSNSSISYTSQSPSRCFWENGRQQVYLLYICHTLAPGIQI